MRKPFLSDVSEQLAAAFDAVDVTSAKIDKLKQTYNEAARQLTLIDPEKLCQATTPVPPAPVDPPVAVKPPPHPTVYSIPTPLKSERPLAPRPKVPRPDPKPVKLKVPQSRPSGRFYLQVSGSVEDPSFQDLRSKVGKFARIVDSGKGTEGSPDAGWVEIAIRGDVGDLIASLKTADLKEQVEKVIEVAPGEGRLLARQCELYSIQRTKPVGSE